MDQVSVGVMFFSVIWFLPMLNLWLLLTMCVGSEKSEWIFHVLNFLNSLLLVVYFLTVTRILDDKCVLECVEPNPV